MVDFDVDGGFRLCLSITFFFDGCCLCLFGCVNDVGGWVGVFVCLFLNDNMRVQFGEARLCLFPRLSLSLSISRCVCVCVCIYVCLYYRIRLDHCLSRRGCCLLEIYSMTAS